MLKGIDLFCGAGGSSFGAEKAGFEMIAGFDFWDKALQVYKENFHKATTYQSNLLTISHNEIKSIKQSLGNVDLILASPECTNHSRAKGAKPRSEESKNTAFSVLKFAQIFKPKWLIIENVVDMQNWVRHKEFLDELWNLDYFVKEVRLNSKDFSVPQSRERLFIICSLTGTSDILLKSKKMQPISKVLDFSDKYKYSLLFSKRRATKTLLSAENAINCLGEDEPFLLVYYGSARSENKGWTTIDKPIGTLTTLDRYALVLPSSNGHKMRMLQPEELKLAMGFDKSFKFENLDYISRRDKIKLMGNGVSPPVMQAILNCLVKTNISN